MKRYNAASEHTTLLLLHEAVQFVDNELACPATHPAHDEWARLAAERESQRDADKAKEAAEVQTKLGSMIAGFVSKFEQLREYKAKHPEQWGKSNQRGAGPRFGGVARGGAFGGGGGGFGGDTDGFAGGGGGGGFSFGAPEAACAAPAMWANDGAAPAGAPASFSFSRPRRMQAAAAAPPPPPAGIAARARRAKRASSARAEGPAPDAPAFGGFASASSGAAFGGAPAFGGFAPASSGAAFGGVASSGSELGDSGAAASVVAAVDSTGRAAYLNPINKALKSGIGAGYSAFLEQKALSSNADSPSFFLYSAQAFRTAGADPSLCLKIVTNVLETSLCNAQTCRVVAYFLCSIGLMDTAVTAFENVAVLAPEEPQSQTDLAFARFFRLREKAGKPRASVGGGGGLDDPERSEALSELQAIVSLLTFVITKTDIPNRFREIEWPVLILLSWVCDWGEWRLGKEALAAEKVSLWPEAELPASKYRLAAKLDVFIWLGWDVRAQVLSLFVCGVQLC